MNNESTPDPIEPVKNPNPREGQKVQPRTPEINPGKPGNETEIDLDKSKTKIYPDKTPPGRH